MKRPICYIAALACLITAGCSTSKSTNPAYVHSNAGYIDFYTDSDMQLSWGVRCTTNESAEARTVFCDFRPVKGNILRLELSPGTYWVEVWFNNLVITGPENIHVQVVKGMVTPVHINLTPLGSVYIYDDQLRFIHLSLSKYAAQIFREERQFCIGARPGIARAYQPKERMPYFSGVLEQPPEKGKP